MDMASSIERYQKQLLRIVLNLFKLVGLAEGGSIERLSLPLYRTVLAVLRPAEAAVRRLIIAAAEGIVVKQRASRKFPKGRKIAGKGKTRQSFRLFDPRERPYRYYFRRRRHPIITNPDAGPRIRPLYDDHPFIPPYLLAAPPPPPPVPQPQPRDAANAGPLCRRLAAIADALKNLKR